MARKPGPGFQQQPGCVFQGNCSDLRGSGDYSASCGGTTKHGISTANRFRPLKREQLHFRPSQLSDGSRSYRYAVPYRVPQGYLFGKKWIVLDEDFDKPTEIRTVAPLTHTDTHDSVLLPNGDYVLLAYEPATRDFSRLSREFDVKKADGTNYGEKYTTDSAVQIRRADGTASFTWDSWDNIPIEDCVQHFFPVGYGHVNSLDMLDGDIIAGFRGCSTVLRIDPEDDGSIV